MGALQAKAGRFVAAVQAARRDHGARGATRRIAELVLASVEHRLRLYSPWRFDRRHQVETRGVSPLGATVAASAAHPDGVRYEATRPRDFRRLVSSLPLDLPPSAYTFVDLGCGKGRVLLLAADHGFGRVVGVELDPQLVEVAQANVLSVKRRRASFLSDVEIVVADAASYSLPPGPTVVYMYNPFGERTIRDVSRNLQQSWEEAPRPLVVIYCNPVHEHLLEAVPSLERMPSNADFWSFFRARQPARPEAR